MAMLSYAVTAGLHNSKHTDIRALLRERLMRPIGIKDNEWSIGYGKTYEVDGLELVANWGGGSYTARAVARVGRLMLRGGNLYDQAKGEGFWGGLEKYIFNPLMDSFISLPAPIESHISNSGPYPASPVIKKVIWASKGNILRKAKGSDNWPITWADDDNLYTTYGDGWGFDPKVPAKLGLGFAKIIGSPPHHNGINIRSPSENTGSGRKGKKGSGILMVNGILYLRLFHANQDDTQIVAVCDVNRGSYGYKTATQFLGREPARKRVNDYYAGKKRSHRPGQAGSDEPGPTWFAY